MRKNCFIVFICIALILNLCGCVYIPRPMPEEGIWYCDELKMSIDFSLIEQFEPDCIKQYADDGTYTILRCYIDFDDSMYICTPDQEIWYYYGEFKYKGDTFTYKTYDDETFYFKEVKDTDANFDFIVREPGFTTQSGIYVRTVAGHNAIICENEDGSVQMIFLTHQTEENAFDKFETGDKIYIKFVTLNYENELEYAEVFDCYEKGNPVEIPIEYIEKLNSLDTAWAEIISQ